MLLVQKQAPMPSFVSTTSSGEQRQYLLVDVKGFNLRAAAFTHRYVLDICDDDFLGLIIDLQTQQGADIVALTLKTTVYMPDFFEPDGPFPHDPFPPTTDEGKQALQNFFATTANPPKNVAKLIEFGKLLKTNGAAKVGAYGFCWGKPLIAKSSLDL